MKKSTDRTLPQRNNVLTGGFEKLEERRMLASVTLNPNTTYQTIQGWGTAAVYPTNLVTIAQAGAIMRDAGMNVVRITAAADDYTYTVGGNMRTPVPISANLDENVARFYPGGTDQTNLIDWLQANAYEPDRIKMIGALWSPPHWMKITTGRLMNWDDNGTARSEYDPIIPWGDYGHNTGGGRVDPAKWTDWARYVLSTIKVFEQRAGLPMHAFSFQNEPNVPAVYNSNTFPYIANDVNDPSKGFTDNHWELYGDALQALANERALHPEITTKFFGPELSQLGGGASNPYNLPSYNNVRQNLISRGLLGALGGWATHEYTYPADSASMWDAWYNGSAHAANIISGGSSNVLGWLWPQPGIASDNKEIWQTETDGEGQSWTKDGAMGFGLKIHNALVLGNVSGYTSWNLTGYSANDEWGVVKLGDINNPTNSYKYDAFKHFSRWIRPGAQRINATFENGKASIGGAHELDTYNGLNVTAFKHTADQRLTMVFTNMKTTAESTTITIPAGMNVSSFQVYQTTGTQKFAQLADLTPSAGQVTLTVPASSFVTITGSYATPVIPAPWSAGDIGSPSPSGASNYDAGTNTFTISGSGADIWNTSDQFHFLSQSFTGNGSIMARVTGVQNTNTWAKAGVMFRNSTAADAMFANVVITPSSGVSFQWRNANGGNCGFTQVTGVTAPKWVKLIRNGNSFSAFYATTTGTPTAANWIQIGSAQTIPMSSSARVGLAVTSHNNGTLCTSTFTSVQVDQPPVVLSGQFLSQTSDNKIAIEFSKDVSASLDAGDLSVMLGSTPVTVTGVSYLNNIATFTLAQPISNGNYTATLLAAGVKDAAGNALSSSYAVSPFFILHGDANQDRKVNTLDFNILAANFGASGKLFSDGNFDYDAAGNIDSFDFNVFAANYGQQVPAAAMAVQSLSGSPFGTHASLEEASDTDQEELL
jgi:O-glycosyl hydrolase